MENLSFIIRFLMYLLVGWPVSFAVHELGHAGMILLLTKQKVRFEFGVRGTQRKFRIGRLTVLLYLEPSALIGCRFHLEDRAELSKAQVIWITIGGSLASLLLTIVCGIMWQATNGADPWTGMALINLVTFLSTSIPMHYPKWQGAQGGIPNDGLQLLQLIQAD